MCPAPNCNSDSDPLITNPTQSHSLSVMKWGKGARVRSGLARFAAEDAWLGASNDFAQSAIQRPQTACPLYTCCFQLSSVLSMHGSSWIPTILVFLWYAVGTITAVHNGYETQYKLPRTPSLPQQRNSTSLPSVLKYDPYSLCMEGMPLIYML